MLLALCDTWRMISTPRGHSGHRIDRHYVSFVYNLVQKVFIMELHFNKIIVISSIVLCHQAFSKITWEEVGKNPGDIKSCVECAREKKIFKPGLFTLQNKKDAITATTCKKGHVAVMNIGPVGHVAYVSSCDDSGAKQSITLDNECGMAGVAGIPKGIKVKRTATVEDGTKANQKKLLKKAEAELKIIGYIK